MAGGPPSVGLVCVAVIVSWEAATGSCAKDPFAPDHVRASTWKCTRPSGYSSGTVQLAVHLYRPVTPGDGVVEYFIGMSSISGIRTKNDLSVLFVSANVSGFFVVTFVRT